MSVIHSELESGAVCPWVLRVCDVSGGGVRAGGAVGLHGRGALGGVAAGGPARRAAQGGLRRLVVRAACGGSRRGLGASGVPGPAQDVALVVALARPPARALSRRPGRMS